MEIVCLDLEGVLVPEIWINFARHTGIDALKATTRDISDYDILMQQRLKILREHNLGLSDIQSVIAKMGPLDGAIDFLDWLRENFQVVILSDTFYEFAYPLMKQLKFPLLICHHLSVDPKGMVENYHLRQKDSKRQVVKALQGLNYKVIALGDSYNDVDMLKQADKAFLFKPPQNVIENYPQFPVTKNYTELRNHLGKISKLRNFLN